MTIEKMREEFESAYLADITARHGAASAMDDDWLEKNSNGDYRSFRAAGAWWGWQASRESLVIELPVLNPEMFSCNVVFGHEKARTEAEKAITAAGLKVAK